MSQATDDLLAAFRDRFARRDYLKAIQSCRDSLAINPRDSVPWRNLAAVYIALGQDADAATSVQYALELDPKDSHAWYARGVLSSRAGKHEEALHQFEKTVELNPSQGEGYQGLAFTYEKLGDMGTAVYYWTRAYDSAPDNAEIARGFGVALMRSGQLSKAAYYLRQALEHLPEWPEARMELGEILRRMNEDRDAVTELLRGLRVKQRPDGLVSLSRIHLKYREPRKALVHLQRALTLAPEYAPAHHVLGLTLTALGEWAEASAQFERAYALEPDNMEYAMDSAAGLAHVGKDLDRAYRLAAAVRIKEPNLPRAFHVMGWTQLLQGKHLDAFAELEKARTLLEMRGLPEPWAAEMYEHLAQCYTAMNDAMMAREMYSRALEADPGRREEWLKRAQALNG